MPEKPIQITHLITGLGAGGAELMLLRLLKGTDRARFEPEVISMMRAGPLAKQIEELGIPVRSLHLQRAHPNPLGLLTLTRWLRARRPQVLATWMYHANFLGSLAASLAGWIPVVWGLHHSHLDSALERRRTIWVAKLCGPLSYRFASAVVCCAESTRSEHQLLGYDTSKLEVIPNGFDLQQFRPDREARRSFRAELSLSEDTPLLCRLGRYHPQKDHRNFIGAAERVHQQLPTAHFVLCGYGITWENRELAQQIDDAGLRGSFHLLGPRDDTQRIYNGSDLACSSSIMGEAFPLVLGEAMSCGVPCVATDVGDSAVLVGDTGRIVPPANAQALAEACLQLLAVSEAQRHELGCQARLRIQSRFELTRTVARYQAVYERVARRGKQTKPEPAGLSATAHGR